MAIMGWTTWANGIKFVMNHAPGAGSRSSCLPPTVDDDDIDYDEYQV